MVAMARWHWTRLACTTPSASRLLSDRSASVMEPTSTTVSPSRGVAVPLASAKLRSVMAPIRRSRTIGACSSAATTVARASMAPTAFWRSVKSPSKPFG